MKKLLLTLGIIVSFSASDLVAQTTLAVQGFESSGSDTWAIASGGGNISSDTGSGDAPANARIRTGSNSWQVNNSTATLELSAFNVAGFTSVKAIVRLSSTSRTSGNGADSADDVEVRINVDGGGFPATADVEVTGRSNARWDYAATLTASTTAGTPVSQQAPQGGTNANNYATIEVTIPDGSSTVALQIVATNNSDNEFWNIDDIELTGIAPTSDTRVAFSADSATQAEGNAGTQNVTVDLVISNASSTNATDVTLTQSGTADGSDGSVSSTSFTFPANSSTNQTVTITVNGDTDLEPSETVILTITSVTGGDNAAAGTPSVYTLTIANDDSPNAWINELHYDNAGSDTGEFVEVSLPASFTDLANMEVVLYNGSNGETYDSAHALDSFTQGVTSNGFTLYSKAISGIQNGPDGLALCYTSVLISSGGVAQFLSYEGAFAATNGCANGSTSTDIGVSESSGTAAGASLGLQGSGDDYSDFTWATFADDTPGAVNDAQVLPVELTAFEAIASSDRVTLTWATASETNNAGFELQQAAGDGAFLATAFIQGFGTTLEAQRYAYTISNLIPGTYRFRLRQVDYDGAFDYSPEVEVTVGIVHSFQLSEAYPNPFNPSTVFSVSVQAVQQVDVVVYDLLGRQVQTLFSGVLGAGEAKTLTFDASHLAGGMYLIQARGNEVIQSRTVTLIK